MIGDDGYASGKTVTHTYTSPNAYTVTLNVTAPKACGTLNKNKYKLFNHADQMQSFTATPETAHRRSEKV